MNSSASFWDKAAAKYAKSPISNVPAYEQTMQRTRAWLRPGDRALELGAGTASTALLLCDAVEHITVSDISAEMIAIGRDKARAQAVANVDFIVGEPGSEGFGSGPYDVVMAFNLLHLMRDLPGSLAAVRDLVRPGGHFISKTTCLSGAGQLLRAVIVPMQLLGRAPYLNFISATALERMITEAGFEIVESTGIPQGARNHFVVARRI